MQIVSNSVFEQIESIEATASEVLSQVKNLQDKIRELLNIPTVAGQGVTNG